MFVPKPCLPVVVVPNTSSQRRPKRCKTTTSNDAPSTATNGEASDQILQDEDYDDCEEYEEDANAYLFRVQEEARRLPNVWTATAVAERPWPHQSPRVGSSATLQYLQHVHMRDLVPPPTHWHVPTAQRIWVEHVFENFTNLRNDLDAARASQSTRQSVPPMKDAEAWYTYCLGPDQAAMVAPHTTRSSIHFPGASDAPGASVAAWTIGIPATGHDPSVHLLLQMDQVMVRRILEHLTQYIKILRDASPEDKNRPSLGCPQIYPWLYALLARLAKPIHRDDAVTLYRLLKHLTFLRAQIPVPGTEGSDRSFLATLNVLIVIVGIYFEQGGNYANLMEVASAEEAIK